MFERPKTGERVLLVQIFFSSKRDDDLVHEFEALAVSAGAEILDVIVGSRAAPDSKYFVGLGKAQEILESIQAHEADLVIFNHSLSPAQERNLEALFKCRVLDREGLILDIFAQRARTHEGKLQVELAQLAHLSTRLVRGWTHLERQKGGIGLRGPGETQLESDRRLLGGRIKSIKKKLLGVAKQRAQVRRRRLRGSIPTVALVGYTNAGKSTLFNKLTSAKIYVADQLFATLDPTLREITIPNFGKIVLADTVGFIRDLPHELVEAFKATLEETRSADLLLHVVDFQQENKEEQIEAVNKVLSQIGAEEIPVLVVNNKIDLNDKLNQKITYNRFGEPKKVWLSAKSGKGIDELVQAIARLITKQEAHCCFRLKPNEMQKRAILFEMSVVISEKFADNGDCILEVKMPAGKISAIFGSE